MTWESNQLPWTFKYTPDPRPSGPYESLNHFPGPPVLIRGGLGGNPSGPPVMVGGSAPSRGPGPPIMTGGSAPSGTGGPPIMLGRTGSPNTYGAPVKLTTTPVSLYGAPSVLAGVRIRGAKA